MESHTSGANTSCRTVCTNNNCKHANIVSATSTELQLMLCFNQSWRRNTTRIIWICHITLTQTHKHKHWPLTCIYLKPVTYTKRDPLLPQKQADTDSKVLGVPYSDAGQCWLQQVSSAVNSHTSTHTHIHPAWPYYNKGKLCSRMSWNYTD